MMKIKEIEHLPLEQIKTEVQMGGKFVFFQFTISILILTFKRSSRIYYIRPGESAFLKGLPYLLITLVLGWWGIPWGPIYSLECIVKNLAGGNKVTDEVIKQLGPH